MRVGKHLGFSLIEIMVVVAIIAIIAAIAYPSYQKHVIKTKRVSAQGDMLDIANSLQRYKTINSTLLKAGTPVTLSDIGHNGYSPQFGTKEYIFQLSNVSSGTWTLTAIPEIGSSQTGDGYIVLNHLGERCWVSKSIDACTPSATTNWDGR